MRDGIVISGVDNALEHGPQRYDRLVCGRWSYPSGAGMASGKRRRTRTLRRVWGSRPCRSACSFTWTRWATCPFEAEASTLFFMLVLACSKRAGLIVASKQPFGRSRDIFGAGT